MRNSNEYNHELPPGAVHQFSAMFSKVPPEAIRYAIIKLYLHYSRSEESDLPETLTQIDIPIQVLVEALGKIIGDDLNPTKIVDI